MDVIAGCLLIKNNKILLVKEGEEERGKWNIPAGQVNNFEKITDGAVRETLEETGLNVKLTGVLPIAERIIQEKTWVSFRFVAEIIDGQSKADGKEILEIKWFTFEEFAKLTEKELRSYALNKQFVKNFREGKIYPLEIFEEKQYIN